MIGTLLRTLGALLGLAALHVLVKLARFFYRQRTAPVRALPGPPNPSFLFGQLHAFEASVSACAPRPLD